MKKDRELTGFGIEVKKRLVDIGKTQKQLAKEIGTSDVYLNLILHGERTGKKYLYKIEKALNLNLKSYEKNV